MIKSFCAATVLLAGIAMAQADDPPPAPKAVQPKQPGGFGNNPGFGNPGTGFSTRISPTTLARYEEESEVLEAQLEVKRAYIKAAEVGCNGARLKVERVVKLEANKAVPPEEVAQAKLELDGAIAQLEIRKAEAKEVEVRLKFAKKRVEDSKAGVRPVPAPRPAVPGPIDPNN